MRYTLDKTKPHPYIASLYVLLDGGKATKAFASEKAVIKDAVTIFGGEFRGGEFHDGVFHGGEFHDGEFRDGVFLGGVFRDGEFHDGVFRGGEFHDGWLPIQIRGSRHFINVPDGEQIKIGCIKKPPKWWLENYVQVGKEEGYTQEQIKEYKRYIDLATAIIRGETEMKYSSFNGDTGFKNKLVAKAIEHQQSDDYIAGTYYNDDPENFKGCSVGCTLYDIQYLKKTPIKNYDDHSFLAESLGVPEFICRLQDTIFEGLPRNKRSSWTPLLLESIPVGVDLSNILPKFLLAIQERTLSQLNKEKFPQVYSAILQVKEILREWVDTGIVNESAAESVAESVESAESAAWAVESAARAAWAAARAAARAARAAAWSVESAARAVESAESAAWAAEAAARAVARAAARAVARAAARAASEGLAATHIKSAYEGMADTLIDLIREAKNKEA